MKTQFLKYLKVLIPILFGVFLVYYSFSQVSLELVLDYFKKAKLLYVFLGLFVVLLSHILRGVRWNLMLHSMGYSVSIANSLMSIFSSYLINYTIPRAGEVSRATVVSNYDKVPFSKAFGTIVVERVIDLILLIVVFGISLVLEYDSLMYYLQNKFENVNFTFLILLPLSGVLLLFFYNRFKKFLPSKLIEFIDGILEGMKSIFKMKAYKGYLLYSLLIWVLYVLMFYVTIFAMDELVDLSFGAILFAFVVASLSIAATNGGIGSYPLAIYLAFSLFGVAKEPSIAFGWIVWASQTLLVILLGGLSLLLLPFYNKKK